MEAAGYADLLGAAARASANAYAPYSRFHVGAAVLSASGRVFAGCNVENASYGLTVCAERVAIWKAVSEGERELVALALSGPGGADGAAAAGGEARAGGNVSAGGAAASALAQIVPCGACLQVMAEFNPRMLVITAGGVFRLDELLPAPFSGRFAAGSNAGD